MKIYKRTDGFEVQDAADRPLSWAVETYGGTVKDWVEVIPPTPPTQEELQAIANEKAMKRNAVLAKLGLTEEEINDLLGV